MIRLLLLLGGLWLLTSVHGWYKSEAVATPITGPQLIQRPGGRLCVHGTVLSVKDKDDGAISVSLEAQGQRVTLWLPPGENLQHPAVYSAVEAKGRCIANGVMAVEELKTIGQLHENYTPVNRPETAWQRVQLAVTDSGHWEKTPTTRSGKELLWLNLPDGSTLTNVVAPRGTVVQGPGTVSGYLTNHRQFIIEAFKGA